MKDTAFHVPSEKIERLPGFYFFNRQTHMLDVLTMWPTAHGVLSRRSNRAEAGLVSTVDEYFAFSRMLLNKGRHGREQVFTRRRGADDFGSTHA